MTTNLIVIFDWDNTLCNTKQAVHKGLDDTMKHFGFPAVTEEDIINVMTRHRGAFWQSKFPLEKQEGKTSMPEAIDFYVSAYRSYTKETKLFKDPAVAPVIVPAPAKPAAEPVPEVISIRPPEMSVPAPATEGHFLDGVSLKH